MAKLKKTNFASYCVNDVSDGCKFCIRGEKLVLFVHGVCSTNCAYCPLSCERKNVKKIFANERECLDINDILREVKESNAKGAGITGGDPLIEFDKTLDFVKALKKNFGKNFHIHIYLSTKLVNENNLKQLSEFVDEVRFHPILLKDNALVAFDIEKIKLGKKFFNSVGVEMPIFPDKKKEELDFILKVSSYIDFVNLNELEIGESNSEFMKQYNVDKNEYTIKDSISAGKWVLNELVKSNTKLKAHLCTAETKNWHQFKNRLLKHEILPHGRRTADGTVVYFVVDDKNFKNEFGNLAYFDREKNRYILDKKLAINLKKKYKIKIIEEYPTCDKIEIEEGYLE